MENEANYKKEPFQVYSNSIQLTMSPFDITLSVIRNSPTKSELFGEIIMSPEHAKALAQVLNSNIQAYEETFGQIPQADPARLEILQAEGKIQVEPRK